MHHGAEDDFQQFLDMNSMGSLGDGLQFDFDFQGQNGGHMMQVPHREALDTPMTGTDASVLMSTTMHNQMPTMSSAPAHPPISSAMMPSHHRGDAISDIDAQIQFLQQRKLQQQQRQMEEQQAAFFTQQQSRMVPPTPQSLEIQAGNHQFYTQPEQTPQQHQEMFDRFQRMKEQQDVCTLPRVWRPSCDALLISCADVFYSSGLSRCHPTRKPVSRGPGIYGAERILQPPDLTSAARTV